MPSPLRLLIVEDDRPTLEFMTAVLASLDAEIRALDDSELAARAVNQERFDGIFLDLGMPKMDGFQLACKIRESPWNGATPIIVVTGRDDRGTMARAFTVGGTFFLRKPLDRRKLARLFMAARGAMLENQRHFLRAPLRVELVCQVGPQSVRGMSRNISVGGILFDIGRPLEPGTSLRLVFQLPGQPANMNLGAVVARVDEKQRIGARFSKLSEREQQTIRQLVIAEGTVPQP